MTATAKSIEQLSIDTIRTLSMDGVQQANSGHPGTPMALAPLTYQLWNHSLRYDPAAPRWPARDRFILSCGHASMLLYSVLHLAGVRKVDPQGAVLDELSISLDDLKNFRQLDSPCAGHPELGAAAGIETTTGPLGQGVGNSVGMAISAKWLSAQYDRPGVELFGFNTFALCSDGDVMEGLGCEAASIAGHLKLDNLCWIYDENQITIEGRTELALSENVALRFEGLGWNTVVVEDANDLQAIGSALNAFANCRDRPTIILLRSVIGFGSPNKADTSAAHGAPLGEEEVKLTKAAYGWPEEERFLVPKEAREHFSAGIGARGEQQRSDWEKQFAQYEKEFPAEAAQLHAIWQGKLPEGWDRGLTDFEPDAKGMATRISSGKTLNAIAQRLPWMLGGSADLAPSNMTRLTFDGAGDYSAENYAGRNFHFGVREHSMAAICNGMALCGLRPYGGTFFVFTDYMRPSMRLAAMMKLGVIYVLTHDSIGLGEDGPTHQPVEHLAACRAVPGLLVFRPGDANEVAAAYRAVLTAGDRPAVMTLTRQALPTLDRSKLAAADVDKGAYVLSDPSTGQPQVILIGTGSELPICLEAQQLLSEQGVAARVVSMPCWELFDQQSQAYRDSVLPSQITARVAVEAGIRQGWDQYIGLSGRFVGMSGFGASAPFKTLYEHFGITATNVAAEATAALADD